MQKGFKQVNLEGCVSGTLAVPVIGENGNWFIGNEDTGVCAIGAGGGGTHYSTDEQVIGTWIDGSTLYRKVIAFGALPNATTKGVAHNITNLDTLVSITGMAYRPTDSNRISMPHVAPASANLGVALYCTDQNIYVETRVDYSACTASNVILEYTKTSEGV